MHVFCFSTMSYVGEAQPVLLLFIEHTHLVFVQHSTLQFKRCFTRFLNFVKYVLRLKKDLTGCQSREAWSIWTWLGMLVGGLEMFGT
jgi:hypothetical protein